MFAKHGRRLAVSLAIVGGAGSVLSAVVLAAGETKKANAPSGTLVVATYGGASEQSQVDPLLKPFGKATGVKIQTDAVGTQTVAQLEAQVKAGNVKWSLFQPFDQDTLAIEKKGYMLKLPASLKALARKHSGPGLVDDYTIAQGVSATVFVCNKKAVARCPENAKQFWDVKHYPGRRAMNAGGWLENIMYALEADGVPPNKLFPLDLDRAFKKLDEIKPDIQVWWQTGDQSQQIFRDQEVAIGTLWDGRAYGLAKQGVNAEISHQGAYVGWATFAVPKGAPNPDAAFAFLKWFVTHPQGQADSMKIIAYGQPDPKSFKYLSKSLIAQMATSPANLKEEVPADLKWVNAHRDAIVKRWTNWLAG